ncbi:MAG: LamG-like jellyroll fold domain-containing protein [Bacteroidota bacterium]
MKTKLLFIAVLGLISIRSTSQNPNLIAQYLFSGNANDNIGSNHGTVNGATLCTDRYGNINNAYNFNGTGSTYIQIPSTNLTNNQYSYSLWVNLNSLPASGAMGFMFDIGSTNTDQSLNIQNQYLGSSNTWGGGGYNTATPHFGLKTTNPPVLSQWYHILSVRGSNFAKLYVNGILVDSVGTTNTMIPNYGTGPVMAMVGMRWNNASAINAKIDDIGIYNCALTTLQVDSIYNAQKSTNCIIAQYLFSGNANDYFGNNHGTVNGAIPCTDRFGNANNAYDFDGTGSDYIQIPSTNLTNNQYSYSLWVNLNSLPAPGAIGFMFDIGSTNTDQSLNIQNQYLGSSDTWGGGGYNTTTPHFGLKTANPAVLGQWYHILSVRGTNYAKQYVNGILVDSVGTTNTMIPNYGSGPVKAMVGMRWNNTSAINAKIDDIEIYNCALSTAEVSSIYIAQKPNIQLTITSPANGATINSECDFKFFVKDSLGEVGTNNPAYLTNSNIFGGGSFQTAPYNLGTPGALNTFCFTNPTYSFAPGIHTFYLWYSTFGIFEVVDSVTLNILNPINDLCSSLSFSRMPITNNDYQFSVVGLDSNETYILRMHTFNGPATDSLVVSGDTSGYMVKHYPLNGVYYPIFSVTNSCGNYCSDSTGNSLNIINGCGSYSLITQGGFQSTTICLNDSVSFSGSANYTNLPVNDTSSFIINWGDGIIETRLIPTYTNGSDTILRNHLYSSPGVYTAILKFYSDSACYNDSLITTINVNVCGNLKGNVYNDLNNNCTNNTGELGMAGINVKVTQGSNTYLAWTDTFGNYEFNELAVGSYTVQINNLNLGYTISCSNSLPHTLNITTGTTLVNFAIYCNGLDIAVNGISLLNSFVPGQTSAVLPYVGVFNNNCNIALPGQIKIILSPCLTYTTICPWGNFHPSPTHVLPANTGDTLVWDVSDINNLGTFGYFDYFAHVTTCTTAQVGDTACVTVMVLPTSGDADISNNTFTACFEIGVSYDPNNKEVMPKGDGVNGDIPINTPNLTYTINFQNTGTATAYNIYLLDSINANLDINSIEILSSSHQVQPYLLPNRTIKFMFANIMLADSTHDEEHSHGYVIYRIKLNAGLTAGTQIKNTAYIYFDYNAPVVTNTTINTIETLIGIKDVNINGLFKIYPNPANDKLFVSVNKNSTGNIVITDVLGKKVKQIKTTELKTEINISDLQSGIYFITLTQENMNSVQKIIISK